MKCKNVYSILDDDNLPLIFNCNENSIFVEKRKINNNISVGNGLIAVGGLVLYTSLDMNCSDFDCNNIKERKKIGYSLIIIGGLLSSAGF